MATCLAEAPFFNLPALFALRAALAPLEASGEPAAMILQGERRARRARRLGILSGSFNPLTNAHLALAEAALSQLALDGLLFAVSQVTIDKEMVMAAGLEDRLLILRRWVRRRPGYGLAVTSRGLYADQARALRRALPKAQEIFFVVGFDKALQIFDRRYYQDREAALESLFEVASLAVVPRASSGLQELEALLARPENRGYQAAVRPLALSAQYLHLSSGQVRDLAREGRSLRGQVPAPVAAFTRATGAYRRPERLASGEVIDRYGLRLALLEALHRAQPWAITGGDLRALMQSALADSPSGRALRRLLAEPGPADSAARLQAFQAQLEGGEAS